MQIASQQQAYLELAPAAQTSCCTQLVCTLCLHRAQCDALCCTAILAADVPAAATNATANIHHLHGSNAL
jgi:hypothetical protein